MSLRGRKPKDFEEEIVKITEHFIDQNKEFYFVYFSMILAGGVEMERVRNELFDLLNTVDKDEVRYLGRINRDHIPTWVITSNEELACMLKLKLGKWIKLSKPFSELKIHFIAHGYWNIQHVADILTLWEGSVREQEDEAIRARYPSRSPSLMFNPPPRMP